MPYEQKEGDVIIFKNETDNERAPQYKGHVFLNGEKRQISLWVKDGAKGKFFAGSIELAPRQPAPAPAQTSQIVHPAPITFAAVNSAEDDLPF
jgi:hypothetical protein